MTHQAEITVTEEQAKDCVIHINIKRDELSTEDTIFTVVFMEEDQGSLYLEVTEDSNPTEGIANNYPEFFTIHDEDKYPSTNTTVDGETI
jgi:hypothetical protein